MRLTNRGKPLDEDDIFCKKNLAVDLEEYRRLQQAKWHEARFHRFADFHDWNIPRQTRIAVLTRAADHCERCGKFVSEYGGVHFDLHHLTYERAGGDELPEDLLVVCRNCHSAIHNGRL